MNTVMTNPSILLESMLEAISLATTEGNVGVTRRTKGLRPQPAFQSELVGLGEILMIPMANPANRFVAYGARVDEPTAILGDRRLVTHDLAHIFFNCLLASYSRKFGLDSLIQAKIILAAMFRLYGPVVRHFRKYFFLPTLLSVTLSDDGI